MYGAAGGTGAAGGGGGTPAMGGGGGTPYRAGGGATPTYAPLPLGAPSGAGSSSSSSAATAAAVRGGGGLSASSLSTSSAAAATGSSGLAASVYLPPWATADVMCTIVALPPGTPPEHLHADAFIVSLKQTGGAGGVSVTVSVAGKLIVLPLSSLAPVRKFESGDKVLLVEGEYTGKRATVYTVSGDADGDEQEVIVSLLDEGSSDAAGGGGSNPEVLPYRAVVKLRKTQQK